MPWFGDSGFPFAIMAAGMQNPKYEDSFRIENEENSIRKAIEQGASDFGSSAHSGKVPRVVRSSLERIVHVREKVFSQASLL